MKLAIRFADKIVGVSIVLAIAIMVFVLFMLGTNQRWFARDHVFFAYFDSAVGLSANMPVQYRGFSIGQVRSVSLADDDSVEVRFVIFDDYIERARAGSIVELAVSPVAGLGGNQFVFRPGTGEQLLEDGATVPAAGSAEAKMLAQMGLAGEAGKEDGIASIVDRIATLAVVLTEAIQGSDSSSLGRTMLGLESAASSLQQAVDGISASFTGNMDGISAGLNPVIENLASLSAALADPDGTVMAILDSDGEVYENLVSSLQSVSATLRHLEAASAHVPAQFPQISAALTDLQGVLRRTEDVLAAIANNPILRRGIPERPEPGPGGASGRNLEF